MDIPPPPKRLSLDKEYFSTKTLLLYTCITYNIKNVYRCSLPFIITDLGSTNTTKIASVDDDDDGTNVGLIVGLVIGIFILGLIMVAVSCWWVKRNKSSHSIGNGSSSVDIVEMKDASRS